jgi:hypothetical protein
MKIFGDHFQTVLKIAFICFFISSGLLYADRDKPSCLSPLKACPKTIDVFGEVLYWYTSETVDWAFTLSSDPNTITTSYKTFTFQWAPGFRVGLGYNIYHDCWNTEASYTRFQSRATDQTSGSVTPAFLAARLSFLEPFSTGEASLDLNYNMFDWKLGRSSLVCRCLCIRPSIGVRGGWITQTIKSTWTIDLFGSHIATEDIKQNFWGVGPTGGFNMKWRFKNIQNHSLSLVGQFEANYLWGHWSIKDEFTDDLFFTEIEIITLDRNFGSFVLPSFLGFEWGYAFGCNRLLTAKIGYEIEDWFNQFQIFSDASGSQNNNLILQGFSLSLCLGF